MTRARHALSVALALAASAGVLRGQTVVQPPPTAPAKPGDLRILASGALLNTLNAAVPAMSRQLHRHIWIRYGASRGDLRQAILAGEPFEVAILLPDVDDDLAKAGKVRPDLYEVARVEIGIGLRGDAPALDISTRDGLKAALLGAKSLLYSPQGAGAPTVRKMLDGLGIAAQVHDSSAARDQVALGPGEYELNVYPQSEIIAMKLRLLGPVLAEFQVPVVIEASIGRSADDPKAALAAIALLSSPTIDASLRANGMAPSRGRRMAAAR